MFKFVQRLKRKEVTSPACTAMPADEPKPEPMGPAESITEEMVQNILVYAPEKVQLAPPKEEIRRRNISLSFEPFNTQKRFNEFDGVIVFQGCFEVFRKKDTYDGEYVTCTCHTDELDKRTKELELLFNKGGFVCVLLHKPFLDRHEEENWEHTDLAKRLLNLRSFYRHNTPKRIPRIRCLRSEFKRFLDVYGASWTTFQNYNENIDLKPIAGYADQVTGMILSGERFFVPVLLPDTPDRVAEFFSMLADALVATRIKLITELPEWASKFLFTEEASLIAEKSGAVARIYQIDAKLTVFQEFKRILAQGDEQLVDSVANVLEKGFGFRVNHVDEYREDLKILDESGAPVVFCEVKGVNKGVTREHVNQADSHRERANLPSSFPSVLIINTHMKNSRNLDEKDQDVALEQVIHAKKQNVLIIRTLDLLRLLHLRYEKNIAKETIRETLSSGGGWLRVSMDKWELTDGQQNPHITCNNFVSIPLLRSPLHTSAGRSRAELGNSN